MGKRRILVTGATGLVGSEVTARLARDGNAVIALVHRNARVVRNDGRPLRTVADSSGMPPGGEVTCLQGDVCRAGLGLSASRYQQLAAQLDLIVHCAAITDFGREPELYDAINTGGTARILDLARAGHPDPIPLLHVSTAYVCGERDGLVRETDLENGQVFGNPYEKSKFEAERLVRAAAADGLPVAIARPSIVVGAGRTGRIRDFKNIYVVLKLVTEGKVGAIPGHYNATLDLVPVDYVADAVFAIASQPDGAMGRTFHLVARHPATLRDFSDVLAEYPPFRVPRFVPPASFAPEALAPIEGKYYERIVSLYESYFRRRIEFANEATQTVLPGRQPPHGKPLLRRLLNYCVRTGYLGRPAPNVATVLAELGASTASDPT